MTLFRLNGILHNYFEQMIMCLLLQELSKRRDYLVVSRFTESSPWSKNTTNMHGTRAVRDIMYLFIVLFFLH